ncbi:hypothetical protein DVS77_09310 [Mycolicibacterium moriokaense]|nr:hypothetical protein DVS77_09310 [Mycolicibacterium moriokaense]
MEIALGISMTSTTVRMVLVEGDKADGLIMECDQFSMIAGSGTLAASAPEQVSTAVLATQKSANRQGHGLCTCGIAVSDRCDAEGLRESLAVRGLGDVVVVSESQAAAALAQTVARAVGYAETALLFVTEHAATLSVIDSADCSAVQVLRRGLENADARYVLAEMLGDFTPIGPQGLVVVDSSGRIARMKSSLEEAISLPMIFPEEPVWALARGAALAAATAPRFEASTVGLAYAQDPDGEDSADPVDTTTGPLARVDEVTKRGSIDVLRRGSNETEDVTGRSPGRFMSIGSVAAAMVVVGAVAVVMAFAAGTSPATEHLLERGQILPVEPNTVTQPTPSATQMAAAAADPVPVQQPPVVPPPPPSPSPSPTAVAVQRSPRSPTQTPVSTPRTAPVVAAAQAPVVAAKPAAPVAVDPPPVALDPPPQAAPIPAAPALPITAVAPPPPAPPVSDFLPQISLAPPTTPAPAISLQFPFLRWLPPFLRPQQVAPTPVPQSPVQQWTPPVQQWTPPAQQWTPPTQQWTPPAQQWTPPAQQWTPPAQQWTPPAQQQPVWPQSPSYPGDLRSAPQEGSDGEPWWLR